MQTYTVIITLPSEVIYHRDVKVRGTDGNFFYVQTEDDRTIYYSSHSVVKIEIIKEDGSSRNRSQTQ